MPKSKRNKQISLTRTKKNGLNLKRHMVEEVRSCVDNYANVFVYSVNDMRNSKLKYVREQWKHSRFFFGKNNVMALALGRRPEEEYRENLYHVSQKLKGQCGLLFSNQSKDEVLDWFGNFSDSDYSRSGNVAQYTVQLPEGPLPQFSHSLEPYLRQLGMPTSLQKGIVHLTKDYEVCKEGDTLTPETARILKLLGHQMAEFRITIDCCWGNDGTFHEFPKSIVCIGKENTEMDVDSIENVFNKSKNAMDSFSSTDKSLAHDNVAADQKVYLCEENVESNDKTTSLENQEDEVITPCEKEICDKVMNESVKHDDTHDDSHISLNENTETENTAPQNENDNGEDNESELEDEEHSDQEETDLLNEEDARKSIFHIEKLNQVNSSPDEKSPIFRSLRNRTIKVIRKKVKK